jgi:multiple sugar transport system permease protein
MRQTIQVRITLNILAALVVVIILLPFGWLLIASITPQVSLIEVPLHWVPERLELNRYYDIFTNTGNGIAATFRASVINSIIVASCSTTIGIFVGVLGGYSFARLRFRGRRVTLMTFLASYMLPPIALVIPLYTILASVGLLDSKVGLVIVYCAYVAPFILWILGNYFMTIPADLEEAALVDGCSRMQALLWIVLPSAKPGIFAAIMFGFILAWDEFMYALIFTSSKSSKTIPVAIAEFSGKHSTDFGLVAAGGIIAAMPPVILAIIFQRYVVSGLTAGGVKG